ncbi:MAG TPA: MotA/TolQ/ExbB proton channel family protein [Bacteroidales bacterium]|nr:MotA/TolQ/ExbB proton channel family protein [Bacteroidales bacterium]HRZ76718.1 MotA/TolQ/ExbB proton channel family protein [Bacteroidales bacterium]
MKKLVALLSIAALLTFGFTWNVNAQDENAAADQAQEVVDSAAMTADTGMAAAPAETLEAPAEEQGFHQVIKEKFIEGGAGFMGIILLTLIFGLALAIERIIYLNLSSSNTQKLLNKVETALANGGLEAAKEVCKNTRGPVAGIFYQGMDKFNEGIEGVEKSVVAYGSVLMGRLEKGLSWINLFIALAPMLGFLGTVVGMIQAFDAIAEAGDISPTVVASGIKVALLTTVFGLIVAIILQIFYNYIVSKVDSLVNDMEDSTISYIDILAKYESSKK